jgi:5'-nucleotidase
LLLVGGAAAGADDAGSPRAAAAVTLLQINDVYVTTPIDGGKAGGLARVASLKRKLAAEGKPVVLTLAGDFLSPSVASSVFKGKQMMDTLNAAGLDICALGNHEFDFGPDVLRERMKEAKFTWVISNVTDTATGKPIGGAATHLIRQYGALKVGYLGLLLSGDEISKDRLVGVKIEDPVTAAARLIPQLKKEGAQAIVVLSHLDYTDDRRLAERFPQIDVIIGGHEHFPITTMVNHTLISKAGSDARYVARIDLMPQPKGPVERSFELIPITDAIPDEPETARVAADYEGKLDKELQVVVGSTKTPLNAVAESVRSAESNLGNLMADAMRADTGADLAIMNSGSIRSNRIFPPGPLLRRDVVAMHPFGGMICKVEVPGSVVLAALNIGVGRLGESVGRFPQVSGVTFNVDPAAPAGNRVRDVLVQGKPLDPKRNYSVAITDYMLKGGDGYSVFTTAKVLVSPEHGNLIITGLENAIRKQGEVAPQVEGRIRIGGGPVAAAPKRPIILDTDMGIDSVMGMLYLLKAPEVSVRAITISEGVADVGPGAENALRILGLTGNTNTPVGVGRPTPLVGKRSFPQFWKDQANTLGGAKLPARDGAIRLRAAEDLILSELERSPEPVTVVAMGPLTNIALALRKNPNAVKKIREVVAMGGAVRGAGNIDKPFVGIKNSVAEWNFYLDPQAAREVLTSGVPVRLIPLEATKALPVTPEFVQKVRQAKRDQTSELLLSLLNAVDDSIQGGFYYFWDAAAAVAAAHPEVMGSHEERITVVTDEGPTLGQTLVAPNGVAVKVGEELNRSSFEDQLLKTILN